MKTMKKMRKSLERLLFLAFVIIMAGCTSLDENFYHPTETYPEKIPLSVGVKIGSLPMYDQNGSITDLGKERIKSATLESLRNVFEKADFASNMSAYDVIASVDLSQIQVSPFSTNGSAFIAPMITETIKIENQKNGLYLSGYMKKGKYHADTGLILLNGLSPFLLFIPMPFILDKIDEDFENDLSKNLDQTAAKIYHDRKQLVAEFNGSERHTELLARIQTLKARLQSMKGQEETSGQSASTPTSSNDQSQILSEIKALQSQIGTLAPKKKASIRSDVDSPSFEAPRNNGDYALVIGVEKYSQGIPDAEYADRDARAMFRYLVALGVPPRHIQRLTDATATRGRIQAALHWLYRNVKPGGTVYVYYSGHGSPGQHGHAYLVPSDGDPSNLPETGVSIGSLYQSLNRLPARHVIVAMDACFTGQGRRSVLGKGARPLVTKVREGAFPLSGKLIALTAAQSDQESGVLESQGHGLFTYYLLKGLDKGAVKNGHVTVGGLYRYLKPKVADEAGIDNRSQTPELEPRESARIDKVEIR